MLIKIAIILPIAFIISVLIAYYIVFKFQQGSSSVSSNDWDRRFNQLVRQKLFEMGFWLRKDRRKHNENDSNVGQGQRLCCKTLSIIDDGIRKNRSDQQLLRLYAFFNSVQNGETKVILKLVKTFEEFSGVKVAAIYLIEQAKRLLQMDIFLLSEKNGTVMQLSDVESVLLSFVFMELLLEDALKRSATVSKLIAVRRGIPEQAVFKAVEFMLFQKSGASQSMLYEEIIEKNYMNSEKLKRLSADKKHSYIQSVLRKPGFSFRSLDEIIEQVIITIQLINRLRNEKMSSFEEKRRNERKREYQSGRNQEGASSDKTGNHKQAFSKGIDLSDELEILGCNQDCSLRKIKRHYKSLAMKKHPDRFSDERQKERAHEEFIKIKSAYEKIMKMKKAA